MKIEEGFNPRIYHLVISDELGYFLLVPHSNEMWEVHTLLTRAAFGNAAKIGREAMKFLFEEVPSLHKLITFIPEHNKLAKRLALKNGWTLEGCSMESFMHDGKMEDQYIYGITRGQAECQHYHT